MSNSAPNLQKASSFQPSVNSKITKNMFTHLDDLLSVKDPGQLKDRLTNFFLNTLMHYHHDDEDLQGFGLVAEDLFFINQFLSGLEDEMKCNHEI